MLKELSRTLCLILIPCIAFADPLPNGMYRGKNEGDLAMQIIGRQADFQVTANGCLGEASGTFEDAGAGKWLFTAPDEGMGQCKISIEQLPNGSMKTKGDWSTCNYWHGAQCSFSGIISR